MPVKTQKIDVKNTKKAVFTAILSNRGIVQRFFLDNAGYEFSITQVREMIYKQTNTYMHRTTIVNAIREIIALDVGLSSRKERVGRQKIHITLYKMTIK